MSHEAHLGVQKGASNDSALSMALVCFLAFPAFKDCLSSIGAFGGISAGAAAVFAYGLLGVIILRSVPTALKRCPWAELLLFSTLLFLLLVSWVGYSSRDDGLHISLIANLAGQCLGMYFICRAIRNWGSCWRYMRIASYAIVVMQIVTLILPSGAAISIDSYSQSFAYQTLPAAVYFLISSFRYPKLKSLLSFGVAVGLILASGSRGPLFALAILAAMLFAMEKRLGGWRVAIAFAIAIFALFSQDLIAAFFLWLKNLFLDVGFSVRIVDVLSRGDFFASDQRPILLRSVLELIGDSPLFGYGIGGDRIVLAQAMGVYGGSYGYYAHNVFLEWIMQFGVPFGFCISCAVCGLIFSSVIKGGSDAKAILLCLMGIGFFPLFVSGSYIGSPLFFMLLGVSVNIFKNTPAFRDGKRPALGDAR